MHWIDHDFLPDICGTVERFIVNRHGEVDGLVLIYDPDRFLFVHLPPHLGAEMTAAVRLRRPRPCRPERAPARLGRPPQSSRLGVRGRWTNRKVYRDRRSSEKRASSTPP